MHLEKFNGSIEHLEKNTGVRVFFFFFLSQREHFLGLFCKFYGARRGSKAETGDQFRK